MTTTPNTTAAEAPKPMPFAIMRNAHEALRVSMRLQAQALEAGDLAAFVVEWQQFDSAHAVHVAMEDEQMFALLDATSGGKVTDARLAEEHREGRELTEAVEAALATDDLDTLRPAWAAWHADHLYHLQHEEDVMMPLTTQTAATPEGRARVVHEHLVTPAARRPDFDWFIGWVVRMLSNGSTAQPAAVATRTFAWGLQHASSPEQWERFRPIVRDNVPAALWQELTRFGLDGRGCIA